jgi:uncharacterized protein (TIGR02996 family)
MLEDAFLPAILDSPDDDAPRLVYADWLEENGQPDRAEFIRLQCERARLPDGDPRRGVLEARERELLAAHRGEWASGLPRVAEAEFERGLLTGVRVPGKHFAKLAAVFRSFPTVRRLRLVGPFRAGKRVMDALVASPYLARLAALEVSRGYYDIGPQEVAVLAASPDAAGLTALALHVHALGPGGAAALAASPHLAGLTGLSLSCYGFDRDDYLGAAGARALASSPHLTRLSSLGLANCGITDEACDVLAAAPNWTALTTLDLSSNQVRGGGAAALLASPRLPRLARLYVRDNPVPDAMQERLRDRFGERVSF